MYDIDCARAITRCARVTLRDWLSKPINDYYVTKHYISDLEKQFKLIKFVFENKTKYFLDDEEITILRNNVEMKILAKEFNKETDLLGIDE